ncbi:hypothetical protein ACH42_09745 [Endozoicomonas sp. (ex Bugula neritina AB1)]|nr:hypothetical protein ACH42_09745 [Endozoicomonas sp. (ex Bugula neritina AB1)]
MATIKIELADEPGLLLFRQVKAGLVLKGLTFTEACEKAGVNRENCRRALYGLWNGPKAHEARRKICIVAGFNK